MEGPHTDVKILELKTDRLNIDYIISGLSRLKYEGVDNFRPELVLIEDFRYELNI